MTYLAIVLVVLLVAILNIAIMVYAHIRVKDRKPLVRDQVVGFLLAGPFFLFIDRGLRRRGYKLTRFEFYGLLAITLIVLLIIVGSVVANFSRCPS